ncbi:tripartite tricarboxylate transporter substrate binding protein [Chelativorans sp.]|uniref:Bug family tripartite tricarboxylate transporter substrate binding protein n=1 Tax=Chelativorans sp. TaxID=2203393 RepID=UPI002811ED63|nr:tripartite tricarboxylate transporter substrate binding protein [Chelativorans sp.]
MKRLLNGSLRMAAAGLLFGAAQLLPAQAIAQDDYPSQTIHFICAFPPGSGADVLVRYFADKVSKVAGQTVVVENKPGAMSNIAAEYTVRAKPDGYTMFVHSGNSIAGNMHILKNPPFDVAKDLRTVATINKQAFMITVRKDSPYQNLQQLTEAMKEKGENGSYAVNATSGRVLAEQYKQLAGLDTVAVQYKSSADSLNDMMSGAVDFGAHDPVFALGQIREGRWRALAIGSGERMKGVPDVPTFKEQGINIDQLGWWGVMVPAGTPDEIANKINGWFNEVLAQPDTQKFLADQGGDPFVSTPEEAQALMERTVEEWETLVEIAQIPQQ